MAYPTEFPLDSVTRIINVVRSGQYRANLQEFAHDIWTLQGYSQGVLLGGPGGPFQPVQGKPEESGALTEGEALDRLERLKTLHDPGEDSPKGINLSNELWAILGFLVRRLLELLEEWRSEAS